MEKRRGEGREKVRGKGRFGGWCECKGRQLQPKRYVPVGEAMLGAPKRANPRGAHLGLPVMV